MTDRTLFSRRGALAAAGGVLGLGVATRLLADVGADAGTPLSFAEATAEMGIEYRTSGAGISNTSAGVYVGDLDGDGREDLLVVGGESPALYRNVGGRFEETDALPDLDPYLEGEDRIHSALWMDYDNDGREDLLLLPGGGEVVADYTDPVDDAPEETDSRPILLHNEGGTFAVAEVIDVNLARWPIGASAADYDGDGYLDVFVFQNGDWADRRPTGYHDEDTMGQIERSDELEDTGSPNLLLRGDGEGFEDVTAEAGIEGERWSLAASFVDLTGDGRPDIHVANDFNEDALYVNRGDGTFEQRFLGPDSDRNQMSSEVGDVNGDGRPDLFVTNIEVDRSDPDLEERRGRVFVKQQAAEEERYFGGNNLWINQGDGEFVDRAEEFNLKQSPFTWGWAALLVDLNNDGRLDAVHSNNQVDRTTATGDERVVIRSEDTDPGLWVGTDDGLRSVTAAEAGIQQMNERGLAGLDAAVDGRRDLVFVEDDGPVRFYENRTDGGNWFQLVVQGDGEHTAIGARATLTADGSERLRIHNARADFQSQDSRVLHWGLGGAEIVEALDIWWPDGTERRFESLEANRRLAIAPDGQPTEVPR